jgi:hypothetical protein
MATTDQTMMKIQRLLSSSGIRAELVPGSASTLQITYSDISTAVRVSVAEWGESSDGDPRTVVEISAPVLFKVKPTPKLFEWVAREGGNYWFGHLSVLDSADDPGTVMILMRHSLLGDYLDEQELMHALMGVLHTSDALDDEMQKKFGGERLKEID